MLKSEEMSDMPHLGAQFPSVNPQALRPDNLGTDPALRSNRELRNILQEFNARIEPLLEEVTKPEGAPVAEVQSNAPPPPAVFENLEAVSQVTATIQDNRWLLTSQINDVVLFNLGFFQLDANKALAYKKVQLNATESSLQNFWKVRTERGQNIDRFI